MQRQTRNRAQNVVLLFTFAQFVKPSNSLCLVVKDRSDGDP
jgi:hypothetical protein